MKPFAAGACDCPDARSMRPGTGLVLAALLLLPMVAAAVDPVASPWKRGIENQRQADLGDGTFLNPVFAGDRPDPSVLRDGEDYYLTSSSFDAWAPATALPPVRSPSTYVWSGIYRVF